MRTPVFPGVVELAAMDPQHEKALDEILNDLNAASNPPSDATKSQIICDEARTLNSWIPHPTPDEVNDYLTKKNLPATCT